jgi:glycerol-3-phosphate dehydrogenase subunit B
MSAKDLIKCDVTVIGAGLAGMAAALFAAAKGFSTTLVGRTGEIIFASGLLDLLGTYPVEPKTHWDDPFAGIKALVKDIPEHPYARLQQTEIERAMTEFTDLLAAAGLTFCRHKQKNAKIITPLGTIRSTFFVPQSMWAGANAVEKNTPCLLVDIKGLKGYSAKLMADGLSPNWPNLWATRIAFPGCEHLDEVHAEHMADALVLETNRAELAKAIKPQLKKAEAVGLPAILGMYKTADVIADLEERIGVPVFEIPTMPPSVPGLRLKEACENGLREKKVTYLSQQHVLGVKTTNSGDFLLDVGKMETLKQIQSAGVILASGRFSGGGLAADRKNIRETVFGLPVVGPKSRQKWHQKTFFDPRGHKINQAGLAVDNSFRPLGKNGRPVYETLFAAGSILAYQDWKRTKSGAGIAIATAWGAVEAFDCIFQKAGKG